MPRRARVRHLQQAKRFLPVLLLLALATAVHFPLTRVFLWGDDFSHLLAIADRGFFHFWLSPQGGHLYLVRNVFFYLPYRIFGFQAEPYGWLALLIHLTNVALFFRVAKRVSGNVPAAAFTTALWGTNPMLSGALANFCVNGHALAGTALLAALELLLSVRDGEAISGRRAAACAALLWMGAASFGVGLGIALAFPFVVSLLARGAYRRKGATWAWLVLPPVVVGTYIGAHGLYERLYGGIEVNRMIVDLAHGQLWAVIRMLVRLVEAGIVGLLWGLKMGPGGDPLAPAPATIGAFLALVALVLALGTARALRVMAGVVLLALAAYGSVALARGHLVFAGVPDLRYQYVGCALLALVLCVVVSELARLFRLRRALPATAFALWAPLTAYWFATDKAWRADPHDQCRAGVAFILRWIDQEVDARPPGADVDLPVRQVPYCFIWPHVHQSAGIYVIRYPGEVLRGRRVRFLVGPEETSRLRAANHVRFLNVFRTVPEPPAAP